MATRSDTAQAGGRRGGPAQFSRLPGGKYDARQNPDGTWDVADVPIFSTVPKGTKGAPKDIVEADLRAAVETHQKKFSEDKFLPRLNRLHNYGVHRPEPAGFFLPREVRPFRMGGTTRPVIFADLISVPDVVFRDLESDVLPYCSVEVRTYEPLTFGALALLDTEPPFFEFPLITIGTKSPDVSGVVTEAETVALASFRFMEDPMPDDEKKPDDEKDGQMAEGEGSDLKSAIKAIEEQLKALAPIIAMADKIQALVGEGGGGEKSEGPVDQPVAAMNAENAKLLGRVGALEAYRADVESAKAREKLFSSAVDALEGDGFALSDSAREKLGVAVKHGKEAVDAFVALFREIGTQDPPERLSGAGAGRGSATFPPEVMAYAAKGPEKFAAAQREWREYEKLRANKAFAAGLSPLDKYLMREVG